MNEGLKNSIADARCELDEQNECGDLEGRLAAAQRLAHLEKVLLEKEIKGISATWLSCGLCHGFGVLKEYGEEWPCACCVGAGGSWV